MICREVLAQHQRSSQPNITDLCGQTSPPTSFWCSVKPQPNLGLNLGQISADVDQISTLAKYSVGRKTLTGRYHFAENWLNKEKLNTPRISSFKQLERVRTKSVIIKFAEEAPCLLSTCFESFGDIYQLCREENNSGSVWVIILSDGWKCYNRGGACCFAKEAPCARWACCSCYEGHWVILSYCLRFLLLLFCWSKWNF